MQGEVVEPGDSDFRSSKEAGFYRSLRDKVKKWATERQIDPAKLEYVLAAPDLFVLLSRLVVDPRVPSDVKLKVAGGLAYFVMPLDVIPDFLGPLGMLDDVFVAAWLLQTVAGQLTALDPSILQDHWEGEEDVLEKIRWLSSRGEQLLGKVTTLRLKGWGK